MGLTTWRFIVAATFAAVLLKPFDAASVNATGKADGLTSETADSDSTSQSDTVPEVYEYEDFDDVQEDRSLQQEQQFASVGKYLSGLVSLLTLVYNFSDQDSGSETGHSHARIQPRDVSGARGDSDKTTGRGYDEAQDRFDFPQKKFKDQQYQPLENYPPYDPLSANTAESYGNDDKKTSYDVYSTIDDSYKVQPANSYDIPYETAKPVGGQDGSSWNIRPVYHPTGDGSSWAGGNGGGYGGYPADLDDPHHHQELDHPEDEVRVSKKPYSYYFLGRKLWYVPLLFSVYFIIYIGSLVLKSIARHKIQFPEKLWDLHGNDYGKHRKQRKLDDITESYENAVDKMKDKYM